MMSKTHIVVGMAAALTVLAPPDLKTALPVIAGSAVGSLICDLDCRSQLSVKDAFTGRLIVGGIILLTIILDYFWGTGIWMYLLNKNKERQIVGILLFLILCTFVRNSGHRGFSHSLLALLLEASVLMLVVREVVPAFAVAFLSHIILDLLNKRPIQVFFPWRKGFCSRLFYTDRTADKIILGIGSAWLVAALAAI